MSVALVYQPGASTPAHLSGGLRVRHLSLVAGQQLALSEADAAMVLHSAPAGTVAVLSGEPDPTWEPKTPRARDIARRAKRRAEEVGTDPLALADLAPISPEALDILRTGGRPAQKLIGKMTASRAADVAIWARLGGRQDVSEMAEARCQEATAADQKLAIKAAAV
jgi:hypothetical protein